MTIEPYHLTGAVERVVNALTTGRADRQRAADRERHATAVELARFDAEAAFSQAERAGKNNSAQIAAQAGVVTVAAFAIGLLAANRGIHLGSAIGIAAFALTYATAGVLAVVTGVPRIPRRLTVANSGWLGVLHLHRDDTDAIRELYLDRADDPIAAYARITVDVGSGAHSRHRRVRLVAWLTIAAQIELLIVILLLACGI